MDEFEALRRASVSHHYAILYLLTCLMEIAPPEMQKDAERLLLNLPAPPMGLTSTSTEPTNVSTSAE